MNRRDFIKASIPAVALPAIAITCKYEDDEKGEEALLDLPHENESEWKYTVYCHERYHGEWTYTQNTRGSFDYRREYMTFDEEDDLTWNGYCGWMDQGRLHFTSFDDATDFVETHVRAKVDINVKDSIYDVYKLNDEGTEIKVAHYWFNGDTGRTVTWADNKFGTDWNKIEGA